MSHSNKVIAITGGASGIGLATAEHLAAEGAKVSICDLNQKLLDEAVTKITTAGGQAIGTTVDVRHRADVEAWIGKTVDTYGKLDGAVNAAGVGGKGVSIDSIEEVTDDDWDFVLGVNAKGVLNSMRAEIKSMNDGGSLVNISSLAGIRGLPKMGAYIASKHAVVGLTRAAAKDLGPRKIRANVVCPGLIDTPLFNQTSAVDSSRQANLEQILPLNRLGQPGEVATLIGWLLSGSSAYITGTTQVIDGGIHGL